MKKSLVALALLALVSGIANAPSTSVAAGPPVSAPREEVRITWQLPVSAPVGSTVTSRIRVSRPPLGHPVSVEQRVNGVWQLVTWVSTHFDSRVFQFTHLTSGPSTYRMHTGVGPDLFRTLRGTGTAPALPTRRVSVTADGSQVDGSSFGGSASDDGTFVAIESHASNLLPRRDTKRRTDIYLKNTVSGAVRLVSRGLRGRQSAGESSDPVVSGDGRFVAFVSTAPNLVANDRNAGRDVFLWSRASGKVTRVAQRATSPALSADGRYVAFTSTERGRSGVRLRDRRTGALTRVSGGGLRSSPSISADGRLITFQSGGRALLHDRSTDTTRVVSTTSSGEPVTAGHPLVSADGSTVAFESDDAALGSGGETQVYRHDLASGTTELLTVHKGQPGDAESQLDALSADGSVVLVSSAATLVEDDVDNFDVCESESDCLAAFSAYDAYVVDGSGGVSMVSRSSTGAATEFPAGGRDLLADGSRAVFTARDALVPGQTTRSQHRRVYEYADVFVRDLP